MQQPRIRIPRSARPGEVIEVRTLIEHPMETGLRTDAAGQTIPRGMLSRLVVRMNGEQGFAAVPFRSSACSATSPFTRTTTRLSRSRGTARPPSWRSPVSIGCSIRARTSNTSPARTERGMRRRGAWREPLMTGSLRW